MTLHLGEVMNADPATVDPDASLAAAAATMRARGVGSAVVVEGHRVVGILTERDVARAVAAGAAPGTEHARAWMTAAPLTVSPGDELTAALDRMLDRDFRHLPVCDGDALVGMVSLRRLVRAASVMRVDPWAPSSRGGLENVKVGSTRLSDIDGARGRLFYAGYDAVELARRRSLEEVWHLLHFGELPDAGAGAAFARRLAALRESPLDVGWMRDLARGGGSMMSRLQAAVAAAGAALGLKPWHERDPEAAAAEALHVAALIPTLLAALVRLDRCETPIPPDASLGHVENYLWMLHGRRPSHAEIVAASRYMILTADHGMNASTFTARVVTSTGADVGSALAAAIGALSGPLHGGAPSLVLDMLDEIGAPERARDWIADAIARGRRIMGFGHRVYRAEDPRAACLRDTAIEIRSGRLVLARTVESEALAALRAAKPGRALFTNVEYWSAVALDAAGIPRHVFTPTFAAARAIGWTAHILEQVRDNRLIRPDADYVGAAERAVP
ncbi:MAG TPA: citrate synthase [Candidatus Binatia bacterium]|nr:citrate synthase [Candidatus Binatia bacterium]